MTKGVSPREQFLRWDEIPETKAIAHVPGKLGDVHSLVRKVNVPSTKDIRYLMVSSLQMELSSWSPIRLPHYRHFMK